MMYKLLKIFGTVALTATININNVISCKQKINKLVTITTVSQLTNLINNNKKVLIEFKATWCHICSSFEPIIQEFSLQYSAIIVAQVDIDRAQEIAEKYGINAVPALRYFDKGNLTKKHDGYLSYDELEKWIKEH